MNHKLRVLFYVLLAVVIALIGTGEQSSLAEGIIIFVDADATGTNNGTSWTDAFTTLQPALDAAVSGDQIWVAEGTYKPTYEFTPGNPRSVSFQMKNGVAIYGGFDGTETNLTDRDWVASLTSLSCDLNGDDGADFTNNAENCYHVFYHPDGTNLDNSAILDGFTFRGGNANGIFPHNGGGGMHNYTSSPTVVNCTFVNNRAILGGGIFNREAASPAFVNCTFIDNQADGYGGGMFNRDSSSPTLFDCTFIGNHADIAGGGMHNDNCSPTLTNCTFVSNSSLEGGGVLNVLYASPIMTNCIFWQNSADIGGGIRNEYYSSPQLINCTFWSNIATDIGGGISSDSGVTSITNSILWDDTPNEIHTSLAVVIYSDIQGGYAGEGNMDVDPLFVDPANGDLHLTPDSPCIDSGTNAAPFLPQYDFEGDPRILDGNDDGVAIVDMGVDELSFGTPTIIEVIIDIKPSTLKNNIPLTSRGSLPVAILTAPDFDAATVEPTTVLFAGASPVSWEVEDIDQDGDLDLVLYFKIQDLDLDENTTEITLTGAAFDGTLIQGTDTVNILIR